MTLIGGGALPAQERAARFDAQEARATLSKEVVRPKFVRKSAAPDPVTKRIYTKSAVVIARASGAQEERPYVPVPLQFKVNTDQLLDVTSTENVIKVAQLLKELNREKESTFAIEGHASAEGDAQRNEELSNLRALRIQSLLREHGVEAGVIARTEGFGSRHAQHPAAASDAQRQEDRRVLVVKER